MHNRKTVVSVLLIAVFVMALCAVGQTAETKSAETKKPKIVVDNEVFVFPNTVEGTQVTHDYKVTNKGNEILKIESVKPACGCTAANFTKEIPPGGEGKISIKFDTTGYGGKAPEKPVTVMSSDPEKPSIELKIKGVVESFADVSKDKVTFKGKPGDNLSEVVTITPKEKFPFKIVEVTSAYGQHMTTKLETETKDNKPVYKLTIINLKKDPGRYFDRISIKTDSEVQKFIAIGVYGVIEDPAEAEKPEGTPVEAPKASGTPAQ